MKSIYNKIHNKYVHAAHTHTYAEWMEKIGRNIGHSKWSENDDDDDDYDEEEKSPQLRATPTATRFVQTIKTSSFATESDLRVKEHKTNDWIARNVGARQANKGSERLKPTHTYPAVFGDCDLLWRFVYELRHVAGGILMYPAAQCYRSPPPHWNCQRLVLKWQTKKNNEANKKIYMRNSKQI